MSEHEPSSPAVALDYALVRALAEAGRADTEVQRLLEVIGGNFGWAAGELWLADDPDGVPRHAGGWSRDEAGPVGFVDSRRGLPFAAGAGLSARVWATGETIWVPDIAFDPDFAGLDANGAGLHAAVALPVPGGPGRFGALAFFATEARPNDPGEVEQLRIAALQVGVYLARARAERRLSASEEIGRAIFEAALDCIVTMDADGLVLDLNPAAEATFGYAAHDVRGRRLAELIIPPQLRDAHESALRRYVATGAPTILDRRLELTATRSDGSLVPVELTVTRLGTHEPPTFAGFVRDITARREMDVRLSELLEREHDARVTAETAERASRAVSEALQQSLLPPHLPTIEGIELGAAYEAAAEGSMVGGDFYDLFPIARDRWGMVIGDISGKGAAAASLTALTRYTLRAAAIREPDPVAVLRVVNDALLRETRENAYCTAVYAELQLAGPRPRLHLAVAGHPLPLVLRPDGSTRTVGHPGTILGAVPDAPLVLTELVLDEDESLLMYTDGVSEARTPDGLLGTDGLRALLRGCADCRPDALVAWLVAAVRSGAGHRVTDDVALLSLRCAGQARR